MSFVGLWRFRWNVVPVVLGSALAGLAYSLLTGDSDRRSGMVAEREVNRWSTRAQEGRLREVTYGYLEALVAQISTTAACNAVHHLNQRCARWLLQSHDRVDSDTFGLTQEYLAVMLGAQRSSVSITQGTLKEAGYITFTRGSITVRDREASSQPPAPAMS